MQAALGGTKDPGVIRPRPGGPLALVPPGSHLGPARDTERAHTFADRGSHHGEELASESKRDPAGLDHGVFQTDFGDILNVLIALEFNHTLQYVITRERGIIQAKIVILIAVLALVRKIIVTDLSAIPPEALAAEAALILALGITYWLMRERDDRLRVARRPGGGAAARTSAA